jgi:hypothetical protein
MFLRVPGIHEQVGGAVSQLGEMIGWNIFQNFSQNPEHFERVKAEIARETGNTDILAARVEDLDPRKVKYGASKVAVIGLPFMALGECADLFRQMGLRFLVTQPPIYFATSDHPVLPKAPGEPGGPFRHGLLDRDIEVTLPLTSTIALVAGWKLKGTGYSRASETQVGRLNARTAMAARRFIAAPKPEPPGWDTVRDLVSGRPES